MVEAPSEQDGVIREVANRLRDAQHILFLTGAGMSAESGLPTYRGVGGLYHNGQTEDGIPIEAVLSGPVFAENPSLTWKYLWQMGACCTGAMPNAAHLALAAIESEKPDVWVITQNVDGLHRAAGSKNLIEVHGHMFDLLCTRCGRRQTASELFGEFQVPPSLPPRCDRCGGVIRPDVVLFEEMLPDRVVESLERCLSSEFDLVVAIGTSAIFPYIQQPVVTAQFQGKPTVEINPSDTALSDVCRYRIRLGAVGAMEQLWKGTS